MTRARQCISKSDLQQLASWSARTIEHKAALGEIEWRYVDTDRPGRPSREYFVDSLPSDVQKKFYERQFTAASQSLAVREPQALVPVQANTSEPQRLIVTEEQHEQARQRHDAIKPLLDWQRTRQKPNFATPSGVINSVEALAQYIGEQNGVSRATVWNWIKRFNKFGFSGLADQPRSDRGNCRALDGLDKAKAFVLTKRYRDRLTNRVAYERLKEEWDTLDTNGKKIPSYSAVRAFLKNTRDLPEPVKIYGLEGSTVYEAKCSPILIRDFFSVAVNDVWVSDHGKHDVWCWNDCFAGIPRGNPLRVWMTAILDMRSRKVWVTWNAQPSGHTVSTTLRRAIIEGGIPKTFYIDNGKDYESIGRIDFAPEASGVLHRLGIKPQYCLPKHPQSKLIESWFSTVRKRFDSRFGPFYCGNSPANRPEECTLVLKQHRDFLDRKRSTTPLMPASEFVQIAAQWVYEDYNEDYRAHSGRGMEGRTPNEVFREEYPADARRMESTEYLNELFWKRERRQVIEGGCVQIFGERYEPADAESSATLFSFIGRPVLIACDPHDIGEAIVLDDIGTIIGRVRAQKFVAHGPTSHEDIKHRMRTGRAIKRAVEAHLQALGAEVESEVDMFRRRAQLSTHKGFLPEPLALPAPRPRGNLAPVAQPQFVEDVADDILSDN